MPDTAIGLVSDYLHRLAAGPAALTDGQLLARYARSREEEAFAELLRRHGPMVLGVCRRALGQTADADDAFQATFIALARKPGRVSECLPGWLFRVAVRTSRRVLRRRDPVRASVEVVDDSDPLAAVEWADVRRLLDEEMNRLPHRFRTALVLCYLEGLTRDEAARQLGWSVRTLHRRLDDGRKRLRVRLIRRGLGPGLLATAVLTTGQIRSEVPSDLARETLRLAAPHAAVPSRVWNLVSMQPTGVTVMKAILCVAVVAAVAVVMSTWQPTEACPRPVPAPPVLIRAPVQKDQPKDDPLSKQVDGAQRKGIDFLKGQQKEQAKDVWNWENDNITLLEPGGTSALALLALLESGLKADDLVVARGLKYLRTVEPKHTYVVGLQTQVFCKANQKEDADRIKRNVKWLVDSAVWKGGSFWQVVSPVWKGDNFQGWTYSTGTGDRTDNSNTSYAISALYAAHKAGFKVDKVGFWLAVRDYYQRAQDPTGGWRYQGDTTAGKATHTMTVAGLLALTECKEVIGKDDKAAQKATQAGYDWLAANFTLTNPPHTFYNYDLVAALGRVSERKDFGAKGKKIEWYPLGVDWLLKNQKVDGRWQINDQLDNYPVISTSFGLRFLASRPE